ncbi:50S ribosomal protein L15 [Blattabacterium cuenoti]|uniref:50S ribosomal protein L15 n=1 Tax=Blattabacterium cuenoti TaxID=1653831 RepID=UPI00374CEBAF
MDFNSRKKIRLGRGQGSGKGGTCGRGNKGDKSRSGFSKKIGFEGGQMPLHRRIPKFGFKRSFRKKFIEINLDFIQKFIDKGYFKEREIVCKETLIKKRLIKKNMSIKILGRGNLNRSIIFFVKKCTKSALKKIKDSGGEIHLS